MSSGAQAARKANAAAAGRGVQSSGMKRQRSGPDRDVLSAESHSNDGGDEGAKSKKRFVGVRQRPSGRWVAEIKDTTQKIRLWLGTFDSAEEGAKAYDSAARALRGENTRTNFVGAMACEGAVAPASKAERLIRLRQMAAAAKACEQDAARARLGVKTQVIDAPAPASQPSSAIAPAVVDDHNPPPAKPPRLLGRRQIVPPQLGSLEPDQEADAAHGLKREVAAPASPPKLEPQQSITSSHSLAAGSPSSTPLSFAPPRSHSKCGERGVLAPASLDHPKQRPPTFSALAAEPLHCAMDASRPDQDPLSHHPLTSCATNRDHVSLYSSDERCGVGEAGASTERDYASSEVYGEGVILREKELAELQVPDIPWLEDVLMDETELLGLDLSCETSSAFDFAVEAIDRRSCTSVLLDHEENEFLALRMHYEQAGALPRECVLLTEPPELEYGISSQAPPEGDALSTSSLWRFDDASACLDGLSSGSSDTPDPPKYGDGGDCTSLDRDVTDDHDVWSSMDLPPLCIVALM